MSWMFRYSKFEDACFLFHRMLPRLSIGVSPLQIQNEFGVAVHTNNDKAGADAEPAAAQSRVILGPCCNASSGTIQSESTE